MHVGTRRELRGSAMESAAPPPPLTVVRPGEGRLEDLGDGLGVAFKLWGEDTGGSVAVVEHPFAVGT
jgi:hypothetical protein